MNLKIKVADKSHYIFADTICRMMAEAASIRGTGIAKRKPEYICKKMTDGDAVIAFDEDEVIGFCYIEHWDGKRYVANSGLIVHTGYRKTGVAKSIKKLTFELSKKNYPDAKLFGITTSLAVMKINSDLGYKPVTFSELPQEEAFWNGCLSCVNYDILERTNKSMCLCTGMVCNLKQKSNKNTEQLNLNSWKNFKVFIEQRKQRIKHVLYKFPFLKTVNKDER